MTELQAQPTISNEKKLYLHLCPELGEPNDYIRKLAYVSIVCSSFKNKNQSLDVEVPYLSPKTQRETIQAVEAVYKAGLNLVLVAHGTAVKELIDNQLLNIKNRAWLPLVDPKISYEFIQYPFDDEAWMNSKIKWSKTLKINALNQIADMRIPLTIPSNLPMPLRFRNFKENVALIVDHSYLPDFALFDDGIIVHVFSVVNRLIPSGDNLKLYPLKDPRKSIPLLLQVDAVIFLTESFGFEEETIFAQLVQSVPCFLNSRANVYEDMSMMEFNTNDASWRKFLEFKHGRDDALIRIKQFVNRQYQFRKFEQVESVNYISNEPQIKYTGKKPLTFAICTYELTPMTQGGAGVFISYLIEELLEAGHIVVLIVKLDAEHIPKWLSLMKNKGYFKNIYVYHLDAVADKVSSNSIFLERSILFATALKNVYAYHQFDRVEFFDYVGIGFETIRVHRSKDAYLPPHVQLVVRMHGTIELIEIAQSEDFPPNKDKVTELMYLMERYALRNCDYLLTPSEGMGEYYSRIYGIPNRKIFVSPPPMTKILSFPQMSSVSAKSFPIKTSSKKYTYLVYGRVHVVKGVIKIVKAMFRVIQEVGADNVEIWFVGKDEYLQEENKPTSNYLLDLIQMEERSSKSSLKNCFKFSNSLDRSFIPEFPKIFTAVIIASAFEAFNLAAHELAHVHMPLVISNIPAFREFQHVAFGFDSHSVDSLYNAIIETTRNVAKRENIVKNGYGFQYEDTVKAYGYEVHQKISNVDYVILDHINDLINLIDKK